MNRVIAAVCVSILVWQAFWMRRACAVTLFPHDAATSLAAVDDFQSTMTLSESIKFHGSTKTSLLICENGFVTFDSGFYGGEVLPLSKTWIAPFGADILGNAVELKYQTFTSSAELTSASDYVNKIYTTDNFVATTVYVISWVDAKKFSLNPDAKVNTFQLAIATDGQMTYAIFLYENIEWYPAVIGASAGDSTSYYRVCDTDKFMATFLPLKSNNQCADPGVIVFRLDESTWTQAGYTCSTLHTAVTCPSSNAIPDANRAQRCSSR